MLKESPKTKSSGGIPYTKTKGPKVGKSLGGGTVLGPYAEQTNLNKQTPHKNNGQRGHTGKAYNRTL